MVAVGQLDADDIADMCDDLPERDRNAVMAAWVEGVAGPQEAFKPTLRIVD
jgi:Mg/Co/Ni transporter MgtE